MTPEEAVHAIVELRRQNIAPVAAHQRMDLAGEPLLTTPPMVLFLGNHSSGKSSLINHLLSRDIQRTGVAPTDDGFTVLMHGEQQRTFDGSALTSNPSLPFGDLGHFGPGLVQHLQGRTLTADLLKHVLLVDSPGMIDAAGKEAERPYDFPAVVRWFALQADLILLFFDPEKPGTTGETLSVLNESLVGIDHKLRIVMNKMDLFEGIRDFARTYGALCWNLSRSLQTKDMPHIYTTVIPELVREQCALPLDGFAAALLELESYISELPGRRADSVLSRVLDEGRILLLRARVTERLRRRVRTAAATTFAVCVLLAAIAGVAAWQVWIRYDWWKGLLTALIAGALVAMAGWLPRLMAAWREQRGLSQLDQLFQEEFREELAHRERADDLAHDWSRARAGLSRMLSQLGLRGLRRVPGRRLRRLAQVIEQDLPRLRRV